MHILYIGKDGTGGSDDNDSVFNDNASVVSIASADSMKDLEGKHLIKSAWKNIGILY